VYVSRKKLSTGPDGDGPLARFQLTLKVSNIEFNRLQSAVIQQNLRAVGISLDVRTYHFVSLGSSIYSGYQWNHLQSRTLSG
jgi:nucleoside-specific outer membrane channel protein Tsx